MIIVRSPLRITLGGGGTDLPSYCCRHEGFSITAAIDKYVYVAVMRPFDAGIYLKYAEMEKVARAEEVQHPVIREVLLHYCPHNPQIEIATLADIPAGTGLGSSGAFTTALVKAMHMFAGRSSSARGVAEESAVIEMERLSQPSGKQDHYAAALGGIQCLRYTLEGVETEAIQLSSHQLGELGKRLLLFFTGYSRKSAEILSVQDQGIKASQASPMTYSLHQAKKIAMRTKEALIAGDFDAIGELFNEHWRSKRQRVSGMSNISIDTWYGIGLQNGAIGGKLVGAGGGGFLLFYAKDSERLRAAMKEAGLPEVRFWFDFDGTKVVAV